MNLKNFLECVLCDQKITIKNVNTERNIVENTRNDEIKYSSIVDFLNSPVLTIEATIVDNVPILYVEVDYDILESI